MYKFILPFRYLLKRRISCLAVLAVAICVFIVFIVMTVMAGLLTDFKQKNHRFVGDCVVGTDSLVGFAYYEEFLEILEKTDFVEATSPVVTGYALIAPEDSDQNRGVKIMGIDPVRHSQVTGFGESLYYHKDDLSRAFEPSHEPALDGCVLGVDLAIARNGKKGYYQLPDLPRMAFSISSFPLTARGALAKAGTTMVNTKTFYYSDNSTTGLARVDGGFVYLTLEQAQLLCGMAGTNKRASAIHVKFGSSMPIEQGCEKLASLWDSFLRQKKNSPAFELLENVTVQSWKSFRRGSIAAMEKEYTMVAVMFVLVGITTIFIVLVVFYMIISHKSKDIGILKSVGVSSTDIVATFSVFSFLIAAIGSAVGLLTAWRFLLYINQIEDWLFAKFGFQLWDRNIYSIGEIPNTIEFELVAVIIICSVAACLLGAFIPSYQAARARPAEVLQVSQL
jgi:ABC-type lipoprotein release transport system permease subunit